MARPFFHTNSLENDQKWPFSSLKIYLISLLLSVEKGAFYIDPMRGRCKLDLSTSGYYKTWLSNVVGIWNCSSLSKMPKNDQFSYFWKSFLKDIVSPINLINAIIINYQLSIKRNALESTVIFFSLGAYVVPGDMLTARETTRAVSRLTLKRYVRAYKK